ncbi:DUF2478 domain-containing protein [Thauera butanivorans]|uniref:DUF2478 domain-containing protein n=1 Tax=Thauera butanivorans TaxID=86174 RepID=UPI0008384CA2|nr:DUF2478 domain-containing protein [Thauera butanivorans]
MTTSTISTSGARRPSPLVAAIVHKHGDQADELLARFALDLRDSGWRVHGIVQRRCGSRKAHAALVELDTGLHIPLYHHTGRWPLPCSPEPGGITAASLALRTAREAESDLAVANRFGTLEALGGGLAPEMLALMNTGRPLLTVVGKAYLADWREFTSGQAAELPPNRAALDEWFIGVAYAKRAA